MSFQYTSSGCIFIYPDDDCNAVVDEILATNYDNEFCFAADFEPEFIAKLMEAGFLVMSAVIDTDDNKQFYLMLPKLHLVRSALFFDSLHIKKSVKKYLSRYELRADAEFERIIDNCVRKHGMDWLTPPLVDCIKKIRYMKTGGEFYRPPLKPQLDDIYAYPVSFGLYREGKLIAGEFGVVCGSVYTSYSGYCDEDNSGTVQIIQTARYLQENGFSFFDLGMPLDYKTDLGAVEITPHRFVELFRGGR